VRKEESLTKELIWGSCYG